MYREHSLSGHKENMKNPLVGQYTYREIMNQGETWKKTLAGAPAQMEPIQDWLKKAHGEVIFTGCGSTYNLALSAAKTWTALTNEAARGLPASELWCYPSSAYSQNKPLLIAVSRSGETTETIQAIHTYHQRFQEDWLSIGCYAESTMSREAPLTLLTTGAEELSVAQTRSFSSMYILAQYLAGTAASNQAYCEALLQMTGRFEALTASYEDLAKEIGSDRRYDHFVFLGSGIQYGLASETMLKLKEMSISVSEAFHFMEFRHGPMSMITDRSLVIGLMSDARRYEENRVLQDMKNLGATTLALAENGNDVTADYLVELASGVDERARGALFLPFLQLMAFYRSLDKGLNPDHPTNLSTVILL